MGAGIGAALLVAAIGLGGWRGWLEVEANREFHAGQEALREENFVEARAHFDRCLRLRPRDASCHRAAARAARLDQDYRQARYHLEQSAALEGNTEEQQLEWFMYRAETGEVEAVYPQLWAYVQKQGPDSSLVVGALACGLYANYRLDLAHTCFQRWIELAPNSSRAHYGFGRLAVLGADRTLAKKELRRAVELRPGNLEARSELAALLIADNEFRLAAEQLDFIVQRKPEDVKALVRLAQCSLAQGDRKRALSLLDTALRLDPHNARALAVRGEIVLMQGDLKESERLLRLSVTLDPGDPRALYQFKQCLNRLGRFEDAGRVTAQLDQLQKDSVRIPQILSRDIPARPRDPRPFFEMAQIHRRYKNPEEAVFWLLETLKRAPDHGPACAQLAEYYESKGHREQAAIYRQKAHVAGVETPAATQPATP